MYAAKSETVDGVIDLLLKMNADPDLKDSLGYNALDYVFNTTSPVSDIFTGTVASITLLPLNDWNYILITLLLYQ